jgi:light-regulated signal transduction histidine kinase (bacteriophytochrome)
MIGKKKSRGPEGTKRDEDNSGAGRHKDELERQLAERSLELEAVRRELEAFTYAVAHDLRAPLRLIHAHVQMLREYQGSWGAREPQIQLEQIQRGAMQMSALIDGILTLSRLSQAELRCEQTSLDDLVKQSIERLASETRERDIEWRIDPLPSADCDPELLLQTFINLIGNAVKYSRPRPHARIEIGVGADNERHVFVRDNGVGFDMRYAGKLFGAFQRLHRQDEFEGTGVGLAAAKSIIERHGGKIWAEAQVGQGAVFRFTLPGMGLEKK